jgi:hypothetical protein
VGEDENVPFPGWDALDAEMQEQGPTVQILVKDEAGNVVNRVSGPTGKGFHRVSWDLRLAPMSLIGLDDPSGGFGFPALPGTYTATLVKIVAGAVTELAGPVSFEVRPLRDGALPRASNDVVAAFRAELESFQHDLARADNLMDELIHKVEAMQTALERAENDDPPLAARLYQTRMDLFDLRKTMEGSEAKDEIGERDPPSPGNRFFVGWRGLNTSYGPTELHRSTLQVGRNELAAFRSELDRIAEQVMPELESALEAAGAPPIEGSGG